MISINLVLLMIWTNDILFIAGLVAYWPARIHDVALLTYTVLT